MRSCILPAAIALCAFAGPFARAAAVYSVLNLGPTVASYSTGEFVDANGRVAGVVGGTAVVSAPNSPFNLATDNYGTLGGPTSAAVGINPSGQVTGSAAVSVSITHAFRTQPNAHINPATDDLQTLGGNTSYGSAINASGQVVGVSDILNNTTAHAFRADPGQPMVDLGTLNPAFSSVTGSRADGVNTAGQVVGYSYQASSLGGHARAYRTAPNSAIVPGNDLGTLGGNDSFATDINDAGRVVGYASIASNVSVHAFRTAANANINPATDDLGTLGGGSTSEAFGINAVGDVVGDSLLADNTTQHAFLFRTSAAPGGMLDLNTLIGTATTNWTLTSAYSINSAGQITGYGYFDPDGPGGQPAAQRAFLLTPAPVPEPACASIVAIGALAILRRRTRRGNQITLRLLPTFA